MTMWKRCGDVPRRVVVVLRHAARLPNLVLFERLRRQLNVVLTHKGERWLRFDRTAPRHESTRRSRAHRSILEFSFLHCWATYAPEHNFVSLSMLIGEPVFHAAPIPMQTGNHLVLRYTSICEKFDAVDVAAVIRGEKHCCSAHVVRRAQATEGHVGKNAGLLLIGQEDRQAGRVDMAGTQNVDADTATLQVDDPAPRERTDRCLGSIANGKRFETLD